ncbi:MAG: TrbC/VirB2 family protein [Treponema sp.]|nr:TrbC/VirB2 family protein [Treponema sp.]
MKSILKNLKGFVCSKSFIMFVLFSVVMVSGMFAEDATIDTLDTWGNKVLSIFSSGWVKALACVALIIEAIGMIAAGQQGGGGQVIKKFAPWIIGTVILLSASGITGYFLEGLKFDEFSCTTLQTVERIA